MSRKEFEEEIERSAEKLPENFRKHLGEVAVIVEDLPSEAILREEDPPLDPELLGLFVGTSLEDRTHMGPGGEQPPRILLFQRNLERYASDAEDLRDEIAVTLYHELGHYLGLDEEELVQIDLG
jgi:predicted Zn-dependent protease with MMP-like domain